MDSLPPSFVDPRYMFIDFNAFFASIEQHDDPALVGQPVIVTPLASEHSGAIAASYEAKAFGITRGTSVQDARRLCPSIAVRPARHGRYVEIHGQLMAEIGRHLPITRIHSIDECLCLLSREERCSEVAKAKARQVKQGIREAIGPSLRCSIGLASSPLLAKLASDLVKPDGLVFLPAASLPGALSGLPLRAIPGIGSGIDARLEKAGIRDFNALWAIEPRHARMVWGSVEGERFIRGLHGYDIPLTVEPQAKRMIGHSRVLGGRDRRPDRARIVAQALLLKAASRLRSYGLYATAMHVGMRFYPEGAIAHDMVFRATQNSWRFLEGLDEFWMPAMAALRRRQSRVTPKLVTVYLSGLQPCPAERDLFIGPNEDARDARQAALWSGIDRLNQRYGGKKVMLASHHDLDLDYLGVKIAFSRIPDATEFI